LVFLSFPCLTSGAHVWSLLFRFPRSGGPKVINPSPFHPPAASPLLLRHKLPHEVRHLLFHFIVFFGILCAVMDFALVPAKAGFFSWDSPVFLPSQRIGCSLHPLPEVCTFFGHGRVDFLFFFLFLGCFWAPGSYVVSTSDTFSLTSLFSGSKKGPFFLMWDVRAFPRVPTSFWSFQQA